MIVDPDFLDHWRTRLVVNSLGDELAPFYIMRIWAHCQVRKSYRFEGMTTAGLRSLCRYPGDAERLEAALLDGEFIVRNGGAIEVPKWAKHNASLISAWGNGAKGGRPSKRRENPTETDGKPTGSKTETQGKPKPNPRETDKTRGDETRRDGIGAIVKKSMGDGKTMVSENGHRRRSSPSPLDVRKGEEEKLDLSQADWPCIAALAESVARKIPVLSTKDRRDWLKYAVVASLYFNQHWLMDAVEAVLQAKVTKKTKQAHFIGVLRNKAKEDFEFDLEAFESMLERIEIPKSVWNDKGVLEIRR